MTPDDRKAILRALEDAPDSPRGVRELLLTDERWRQSLTDLQQTRLASSSIPQATNGPPLAPWHDRPGGSAAHLAARVAATTCARRRPGAPCPRGRGLRTAGLSPHTTAGASALGLPLWSPHDLRHRRISLLHQQGRSWAEVGAFVGQRKLSITADTYTHVLVDGRGGRPPSTSSPRAPD